MLSRRHLRIKVMQALYAFYQSPQVDFDKSEKQLFDGIDKIYDLYIYLLLLLPELADQARIAGFSEKQVPTEEHTALSKFAGNLFIRALAENEALSKAGRDRMINWKDKDDTVTKIFLDIKKLPSFQSYTLEAGQSFESDKKFAITLFTEHVASSVHVLSFIEEKNIFWNNSEQWMSGMVIKTMEDVTDERSKNFLNPLFRDDSDRKFVHDLFVQTILNGEEFEKNIAEKTKNWELDRIALMDMILMKMALAELIHFKFIPVKVTINEYLDIARNYSTPQSNKFINGIIDKLSGEFRKNGKIKKEGVGLIE